MAAMVAGLFFLRFWRESHDRFFLLFAIAFGLLGLERIPLLIKGLSTEMHYSVYLIRLAAFLVFIAAIVLKNCERSGSTKGA